MNIIYRHDGFRQLEQYCNLAKFISKYLSIQKEVKIPHNKRKPYT